MRVLCLGDVVGGGAVARISAELGKYIDREKIDFTVINGENACMGKGNGISAEYAEALLMAGADCITGGNHSFGNRGIYEMLEDCPVLLRPHNYSGRCPGKGYALINAFGASFLVINIMGRVLMNEGVGCPFDTVDKILADNKGKYNYSIMDIHAETTSEKLAIASYFDGRVDMMFGTHTHVMTADERILPGGSGYITDVGMCGPDDSVLGVKKEIIVEKLRNGMPCRFELSDNKVTLHGVIFTLEKGKVCKVERVVF